MEAVPSYRRLGTKVTSDTLGLPPLENRWEEETRLPVLLLFL